MLVFLLYGSAATRQPAPQDRSVGEYQGMKGAAGRWGWETAGINDCFLNSSVMGKKSFFFYFMMCSGKWFHSKY